MEAPTAAYRGHLKKIEAADKRRTKPFDENVMKSIENVDGLIDVLAGDMQLPGSVEGQLLMTLANAVQQQGGQGLRIREEPWMLLDLVLVARHRDPANIPACLIGEIMLKAQVPITFVDGKNVTITQMFEEDYARWSTSPDPDVVAGNHFKYGYALLVTEGDEAVGRALDQFALAAKHPEHTSNTAELISKVLEAAPEKKLVSDASGFTYELNTQAADSASKVLVNGKPVGQAIPTVAAPKSAGATSAKSSDEGNSTMLIVGAVVAVVAIAVGAWAFANKSKKH